MFSKILIANRGEIACRVIKTARRMGIATVAVYSDADRNSLHVSMADEAVHIGGPAARDSYLRIDRIIDSAKKTGAQAIHPGYGFLSENAEFCRTCAEQGITFIGPGIKAIEAMGSKSAAKEIMESASVPLVPGYHGADIGDSASNKKLKQAAVEMGFPVLLKASAGGGGKGMRQVWKLEEFDEQLATARREAQSSFNDGSMLVEKYLTQPRHVEIQVFCDSHGNGVYLAERDCSVQRRHQKVIEEAPAPNMADATRSAMGEAALAAAKAIDYCGAGTVEFLLDTDGSFYFMEMNTRLQVEHPVTEMITGQDLVEWQLRVAAGENLPLSQEQISLHGHAFEARVYAEDPEQDFLPCTGPLRFLQPPEENSHVRVDTGVQQGDEISVYYDPMIAKLIVWDENRDRALARMRSALRDFRISGIATNIDFLYNLASHEAFQRVELDTGFIGKHESSLLGNSPEHTLEHLVQASLFILLEQRQQSQARALLGGDPHSPWAIADDWRLNENHSQELTLLLHGETHTISAEYLPSSQQFRLCSGDICALVAGSYDGNNLHIQIDGHSRRASVVRDGAQCHIFNDDGAFAFEQVLPDTGDAESHELDADFTAPMNGTIIELSVGAGQAVEEGAALLVMEAMKMEHTIRAPAAGRVSEFFCAAGDLVDGGIQLLEFERD